MSVCQALKRAAEEVKRDVAVIRGKEQQRGLEHETQRVYYQINRQRKDYEQVVTDGRTHSHSRILTRQTSSSYFSVVEPRLSKTYSEENYSFCVFLIVLEAFFS